MIPASFEYMRANSVAEAIQLLEKHGDDAKLLAGGHSLIPAMKLRLNQPGVLIDISKIEALRSIREEGDHLVIGAGVTHHQIADSELIQQVMPVLSETAQLIGDIQVRNAGTLGGSLVHADPAADWPAVLLACEAQVEVEGPNGKRSITATDFFTGFYTVDIEEDEVLTAIRFPKPGGGVRQVYLKFPQPASRFAIVGCAVSLRMNRTMCEDVRVAFTGIADGPFRDRGVEAAMEGQTKDADHIAAAAEKAAVDADILSDHYASEEYRHHLAKVYARKALEAASA